MVETASIIILAVSFASIMPLSASRLAAGTVTVTSIVRVSTALSVNTTFIFETQGTYRIPLLAVNATLIAWGNGLSGVLTGQQLNLFTSWGPTASCITNDQGLCSLTFSIPPLGGANTLTVSYDGNQYFMPSAATKVV